MSYPTFSIIMPMFNSGKTIVGSVNSVRSQNDTKVLESQIYPYIGEVGNKDSKAGQEIYS